MLNQDLQNMTCFRSLSFTLSLSFCVCFYPEPWRCSDHAWRCVLVHVVAGHSDNQVPAPLPSPPPSSTLWPSPDHCTAMKWTVTLNPQCEEVQLSLNKAWPKWHTLTLRVLTGSLSRETVSGKITSSVKTTGSSRGDWEDHTHKKHKAWKKQHRNITGH